MDSSLQRLNRLLYDEFVKSVLKIVDKLDLTLKKQNVGEQEVRIFVTNKFASFLYSLCSDSTFVEYCRKLVSFALICVVDTFLIA